MTDADDPRASLAAAARRQRLGETLRANLQRRKRQARARRADGDDRDDGHPSQGDGE